MLFSVGFVIMATSVQYSGRFKAGLKFKNKGWEDKKNKGDLSGHMFHSVLPILFWKFVSVCGAW